MKKILFLSVHLFESKRQANFHHIANACAENGNEVTFCTVPNSLYTLLRINHNYVNRLRLYYYAFFPKLLGNIKVTSYFSLIYPLNKFLKLNNLFNYLFQHGYSSALNEEYDSIIIENGIPLFLFEKLRKLNPGAKFIYRVSDPVKKNMGWSGFLDLESRIIKKFNLISTPASLITKKLLQQYPSMNIQTHYHGINKKLFLKKYENPFLDYKESNIHFVFVGASKLDTQFLDIASNLSKNYIFHIIGPFEPSLQKINIIYYGEMKFESTIRYIKYANICMQTLVAFPYSELYEKTLKYTQYSFFKKFIIAPTHMQLKDANVSSYDNNEVSIQTAINKALSFDSTFFDITWIKTWNDIANELLE